jgi:hypothetical protein
MQCLVSDHVVGAKARPFDALDERSAARLKRLVGRNKVVLLGLLGRDPRAAIRSAGVSSCGGLPIDGCGAACLARLT